MSLKGGFHLVVVTSPSPELFKNRSRPQVPLLEQPHCSIAGTMRGVSAITRVWSGG